MAFWVSLASSLILVSIAATVLLPATIVDDVRSTEEPAGWFNNSSRFAILVVILQLVLSPVAISGFVAAAHLRTNRIKMLVRIVAVLFMIVPTLAWIATFPVGIACCNLISEVRSKQIESGSPP